MKNFESYLTYAGFFFVLGIVIFCIPNWMKPSSEINWLYAIPMALGGLFILILFGVEILKGIYYLGKTWR